MIPKFEDVLPLIAHYDLIRLNPKEKIPTDKWTTAPRLTEAEAREWMANGGNLGVRIGPDDMVVDVDPRNFNGTDSAKLVQEKLRVNFEKFPCVETPSGGRHYYMKIPAGLRLRKDIGDFPGIEFKTQGGQVVTPGSVHPNGKLYEWDVCSPGFPASVAPETLWSALVVRSQTQSSGGAISTDDLAVVLGSLDPEAFRNHDQWFRLMCATHEATSGSGRAEFIRWSTSDPMYATYEDEIGARWDSLTVGDRGNAGVGTLESILIEHGVVELPWRREVNDFDEITEEDTRAELSPMDVISRRFFCVNASGKFRVFERQRDDSLNRRYWVQYSKKDFLDVCESVCMYPKVQILKGDKWVDVPAGLAWLTEHNRKLTYNGIVFAPDFEGHKTPDGRLNIWRGFAVKPRAGDWGMLKKLVFDVIARGDQTSYDYIMNWLARAVQKRHEPGEVALVIKGGKGVGKGTLGRAFCHLFGPHGLQVASPSMLVGRFNMHLRDVVALFADEAFWAGDKTGESVLKSLVTEPIITYEGKGTNAEIGRNCCHIIMASNADWVVPASLERERRFAVFETLENTLSLKFFKELNDQMVRGGYEAMLHELMTRDISGFEVRNIPATEALAQQKLRTLGAFDHWFIQMVQDDFKDIQRVHSEWNPEALVILRSDLQDSLAQHYRSINYRGAVSIGEHLGMQLRRLCPGVKFARVTRPAERIDIGTDRPYAYTFPPIDVIKKHLNTQLGMSLFSSLDTPDSDESIL